MLRLLGGAVLAVCAAWTGFAARRRLADRVTLLRALAAAFSALERELAFRLTPLPRLFARAAEQSPPPVDEFFRLCGAGLARLEEAPLSLTWERAAARTLGALTGEERQVVSELGTVLGRYDGERCRQALCETAQRMENCIGQAAEQRDRLGRVYGALGVTGGLLLLILVM